LALAVAASAEAGRAFHDVNVTLAGFACQRPESTVVHFEEVAGNCANRLIDVISFSHSPHLGQIWPCGQFVSRIDYPIQHP
jgi:hypothetical protein